jgi:Fe-S-cluster containining protein
MTMEISAALLSQHDRWLRELDQWFHSIQSRHGAQMQCGRGCALCCHGLFDISIPDATRVTGGFAELRENVRKAIVERATMIHRAIAAEWDEIAPPYLLDSLREERIDALVEVVGEVGCPFLDRRNSCLIYEQRPVACRLEGVPMVDVHSGLFGDWCELNFSCGVGPEVVEDSRLDYDALQEIDQGPTIFIPSLIYAVSSGEWNITVR